MHNDFLKTKALRLLLSLLLTASPCLLQVEFCVNFVQRFCWVEFAVVLAEPTEGVRLTHTQRFQQLLQIALLFLGAFAEFPGN